MEKKPKLKFYLALIAVNLVLAGAIAGVFFKYIDQNQKLVYMGSVQDVKDASSRIAMQLYRYMRQEQDAVSNIAYYITETGLNAEETVVYLEHIKTMDGMFAIVSCEDYTGLLLDSRAGEGEREADYASNAVVTELCDAVREGTLEEKELMITAPFPGEEKVIAYYQPLSLDGTTKVLLYIMNLQQIIKEALDDTTKFYNQGILIDTSGNLLYDIAPIESDTMDKNFFSYVKGRCSEAEWEEIYAKLTADSDGSFTLRDEMMQEWLYIFVKVDGIEDWIYVYTQMRVEALISSKDLNSLVQVVTLMGLFGGVNIAVIVWQNQKLKKGMRVIAEKNKELEAANQAKNVFISNMSHEIRTPINAVLGMDEMILRESAEPAIRDYAVNIKSAGKTLLGIINDILDFSKIESGKLELIDGEYEVGSLINDLLMMIEGRAKEKGLTFSLHLNEAVPHLLYGDELRIKQIILNILTNAVKYTEKGGVTFTVDYEKLDEERILLKVAVKDTGIGIKPEEKERLFTPFERIDEKRNRTIEGTGLGMSIVMRLLQQMGSSLEVESVYGEGSEFSFRLEQKVADWEQTGNLEKRYLEAGTKSGDQGALFYAPKARILAVDDTPMNLYVLQGLLKRTGVQLDTAQSGKDCLSLLEKNAYDVLLLDHRMPEMDGIETLHKIKEMKLLNPAMAVIALTANVASGASELYIKEGFCDFLSKPVSGSRLERMLLKYLPKECLEERKAAKEKEPEEETEAIDKELSALLPELDFEAAKAACGSKEVLEEVMKEFAATADTRRKEITTYYEAGDLKNYTIKVHALKSSARLIGATELSKQAAHLEECGDSGAVEEIYAETEPLLNAYRSLAEKLKEWYNKDKAAEKPQMEETDFLEMLLSIGRLNEEFDFDSIDALMHTLSEYRLPKGKEELYGQLREAVYDVNQEKIAELIKNNTGGKESE